MISNLHGRKSLEKSLNNCGKLIFIRYTLIEVVIASAIMALAFTAILGISISSSARIVKSRKEWSNAHMVAQATEYFLLAGKSGEEIPEQFFPYEKCRASMQITEPESLPDGVEANRGAWKLATCIITVQGPEDGETSSIKVDKILKDADL